MFAQIIDSSRFRFNFRYVAQAAAIFLFMILSVLPQKSAAQNAFLTPGWILDADQSEFTFQSTKGTSQGIKIETSSITKFEGQIDEDGAVTISFYLDSVDTNIDLRNVRMRFLFFETFQFPIAQVTTTLSPDILNQLFVAREIAVELPLIITLHGTTVVKVIPVQVTLTNNDIVTVNTLEPIAFETADFGLLDGLQKLEEAANVTIVSQVQIGVSLRFVRAISAEQFAQSGTEPVAGNANQPVENAVEIASVTALETEGEFSPEECRGRFEILSRTDYITFGNNSAALNASSHPLLNIIIDIIGRCPSLTVVVAGHTDSNGSDAFNQALSERRANAVMNYLQQNGVGITNLQMVGYGEAKPAFPNTTNQNRSRNRRIEFFSLAN